MDRLLRAADAFPGEGALGGLGSKGGHMICQDIMKDDVACLSPMDTAQMAAQKMRDLNVGFLPVCDASGKPIGTLTDRDLAVRLVAEDRSASNTSISVLMTDEVITCRPEDDIQKAQSLMAKHHKSRIIIQDGGRIAGVISLSDIAQNVDALLAARTMRQVSQREVRSP
jgi:CBS domain-containing protein